MNFFRKIMIHTLAFMFRLGVLVIYLLFVKCLEIVLGIEIRSEIVRMVVWFALPFAIFLVFAPDMFKRLPKRIQGCVIVSVLALELAALVGLSWLIMNKISS